MRPPFSSTARTTVSHDTGHLMMTGSAKAGVVPASTIAAHVALRTMSEPPASGNRGGEIPQNGRRADSSAAGVPAQGGARDYPAVDDATPPGSNPETLYPYSQRGIM